MASTFFGFNIVKSGLAANRAALNTVSHNITNVNTEGYSRQRVDTHASRPDVFPSVPGVIGTGVDMEHVRQLRDAFLDFKFRGENTKAGEYEGLSETYKTIETIFNEPSDSSILTVMDEFFSAIHELGKTPESLTTRALVRQRAIAFQEIVHGISNSFEREQENLDFQVEVLSGEINGYAKQIAELNKSIYNIELNGQIANDLRDRRNLVVDKLSKLIDINYYEDTQGRFYVDVTGRPLVNHYTYDQLEMVERSDRKNPYDIDGLHDLKWKSGSTFGITGGKLKARLDMRDNISGEQKGLPYYMDRLNQFVDKFTSELNRIHQSGYDLRGDTGINLFTMNNMTTEEYNTFLETKGFNSGPGIDVTSSVIDGISEGNSEEENNRIICDNIAKILLNNSKYNDKSIKLVNGKYLVVDRLEAKNLTISRDVEDDLNKISASKTAAGAPGDGDNALLMVSIRRNSSLFAWGSPDDYLKSLISNLGVDAQDVGRSLTNENLLIKQLNNDRQSIMGVSLDEEMANMVKYQQSFNACGRMMNVIDEMIDLVVNRLGTVGR